jgi:hypothetical protein
MKIIRTANYLKLAHWTDKDEDQLTRDNWNAIRKRQGQPSEEEIEDQYYKDLGKKELNPKKPTKKAQYGQFGDTVDTLEEGERQSKTYTAPENEGAPSHGLRRDISEEDDEGGYTLADIERDMPGTIAKVLNYLKGHPGTSNLEVAKEVGVSPLHVDEVAAKAGIEIKDDLEPRYREF